MSESESVGEGSAMLLLHEDPPPKLLQEVRLKPRIKSKSRFRHGHFRACFGPNGQIIKTTRKGNKFGFEITRITNGNIGISTDIHRQILEECFDLHKNFHARESGGTFAELCNRYSALFQKFSTNEKLSARGRLQVRHVSLAFDLLRVLWEKPVSTYPELESKYGEKFVRRINFDKWMRKVTKLDIENRLRQLADGPDKIFWLLASNQKQQAIQHCWDIRNLRLASIISGCNRKRLRVQIRVWKKEGNWATFPLGLKKCYLLLSGQFTEEVIKDMSWVQYMHIITNYDIPRNMPIAKIVETFQHSFKNDRAHIPPPKFSFHGDMHGEAVSIQYGILQLFTRQLNHLEIEPLSCTSSELDFVWLWHLQDALHAFQCTPTSEKTELLYRSLIEQLERIGSWEYAAYVALAARRFKLPSFDVDSTCKLLLNLNYPRTKEMKEVVRSSNKPGIQGLLEEELARERPQWEVDFSQLIALGIEEEWIHGACAITALYEEDYETALDKFVRAKDIPQAYHVLCSYELPRLILDGHFDKALGYLKTIEEHKDSIPDYEERAGIYQTYLQMNEHEGSEAETLEDLRSLQEPLRKINPQSQWEDALVEKMLLWSEQVESNLMHSIGMVVEDTIIVGDLKMQELDSSSRDRSNMSHISHLSQSSVKSQPEKVNPLLLEELVNMEVMDTYEI